MLDGKRGAVATILGLTIAAAIFIRCIFFVGLVSGDPQDDGVYYGNAFALYRDGPTYLARYRDLPSTFLANPIDQFHVRPMVTYPIAASFALFGPGEESAAAWGFICSIFVVLVVYRLGTVVHDRAVGGLAALLCAFYPLEVINGTRILSDVQVGLFSALGLLLVIEGSVRGKSWLYALAGVAAACAYLANARGLITLLMLLGWASGQVLFRQTSVRALLMLMCGFMAIFGLEALAYYLTTGDPLLNYRIHAGAARFKYLYEPVTNVDWNGIRISYTNGQPLELLRSVLLLQPRATSHFGYFFYLFAVAAVWSLSRRRNLRLLAVALGLLLYLEFGPVQIRLNTSDGWLHYMMVFKQERFLLILTAPVLVVIADFLCSMDRRSRVIGVLVMLALMGTSFQAITRTKQFYRAGLQDLRTMAPVVESDPERTYWGDFWAIEHLRIFTRYRAENLRVLDAQTPQTLDNACLMLGGSRGVELLADYVSSTLPSFARRVLDTGEVPSGWRQEMEIRGERNPERTHDLKGYCGVSPASLPR